MARDDLQGIPSAEDARPSSPASKAGYYRWTICALLFFATTVNYLDRVVVSLLAGNIKDMFVVNATNSPKLLQEFTLDESAAAAVRKEVQHYVTLKAEDRKTYKAPQDVEPVLKKYQANSEQQFARVNMSFQAAYAVGLVLAGRIMDVVGLRWGFSLAVFFWSLAGMGHALARGFTGFVTARFALGLSEAGNFPAAVKTVAEWFPKRERALATGIFNAGSNVGAILAPAMVPWIALNYGWKEAFVITGAIGMIWLFFWFAMYRPPAMHPRVRAAELAVIQSDPPDPKMSVAWRKLIPLRQTWAFSIGKFLTDPIWWFFLFWTPSFFKENFGYGLDRISGPMIVIYLAADFGSIAGGWLSSSLIKRGWSINRARKTAMLVCALCVVPVFTAGLTDNPWVAVGVISLALGAHQGWSCNLFTLVSDTFPRFAVGSVVGFGGMAGAIGGLLMSEGVGRVLKSAVKAHGESAYMPMFLVASGMYLITLLIIHVLVPRLTAARIDTSVSQQG